MRNIRLGSLLGIPILVNPSWFVIFGLVTWLLATNIYPAEAEDASNATLIVMAAVSVVLFFASVILHELAHSAIARLYRIPVRSITLFIFGGVAQITREATKPLAELAMAIAGPLTSLALGGLFIGAYFAVRGSAPEPVEVVLAWLGLTNVVLAVFNMLPAFPMDGGRVFRSLVWLVTRNYNRATIIAAWTGRVIAWVMIAVGAVTFFGLVDYLGEDQFGGAWFALIGLFLENAARQSLLQNRLVTELRRYHADDLMIADPPVVDAGMSIAALARGVLELNPRVCYFVEDEGKLAGILSAYQMRAVPQARWDSTTASDAMVPSAKLRATERGSDVSDILVQMENNDLTHMPVVEDGRVIGVIGRDRIIGVLRQAGLLPG